VNENTKDGTARATARRRLIRGAFGVPAALTLYSGNVFAASSNLRALENQLKAPEYPGPVTVLNPGDTWIRVQVYAWPNASSATALVVSGAEVAQQPGCGSSTSFVSDSGWANLATSTPFDTKGKPPELTNPVQWAALRFNASGVVVGVIPAGASSGDGTALTRSAGGSLRGACFN